MCTVSRRFTTRTSDFPHCSKHTFQPVVVKSWAVDSRAGSAGLETISKWKIFPLWVSEDLDTAIETACPAVTAITIYFSIVSRNCYWILLWMVLDAGMQWVANAGIDFHRESQLLLNFSVNGVGCWFPVICKCLIKFCELRCCEWCCKPIVNSIAGGFPFHSNPLVLPLWVATAGLNFVNPIVVNSVAICLEFHCCECSFHCPDFRCCEWCYYGRLQVLWMGLVSLVEFVLCLRIEFVGRIELLGLDEDCHLWGGLSFCYSVIFGIKSVWSEVDWVECYFHALKFANFWTW